jgi:hypothetical protein
LLEDRLLEQDSETGSALAQAQDKRALCPIVLSGGAGCAGWLTSSASRAMWPLWCYGGVRQRPARRLACPWQRYSQTVLTMPHAGDKPLAALQSDSADNASGR